MVTMVLTCASRNVIRDRLRLSETGPAEPSKQVSQRRQISLPELAPSAPIHVRSVRIAATMPQILASQDAVPSKRPELPDGHVDGADWFSTPQDSGLKQGAAQELDEVIRRERMLRHTAKTVETTAMLAALPG
jgi:hypothetical protein